MLIQVISKEKQKMDGLFTFNSQQLQAMTKRPSSTDHPPNIRKRIIGSKFCKKQSLVSQASTREDITPPLCDPKTSPAKKVTFNLDNPLPQETNNTADNQSFVHKAKSLNQADLKEVIFDAVQSKLNLTRYPLEQIDNKKKANDLGKRTLSTALSSSKQSESLKEDDTPPQEKGSVREKRTFSLKLNPKIVPISERKLPKAFKIHCVVDNKGINRRKKFADEVDNGIISSKSGHSDPHNLAKFQGVSRLEKMLMMEAKLFEKLFKPAHS